MSICILTCILSITLVALDPPHEEELEQAYEAFEAGRIKESLILFRKILELDPDEINALHRAGYILNRARDFAEAERYFLRALAINGRDKYSLQMLGNIQLELFRPFKAHEYYRRALDIDPNDEVVKENIALAEECIARARRLARLYDRSQYFLWGAAGVGSIVLLLVAFLEIKRCISS